MFLDFGFEAMWWGDKKNMISNCEKSGSGIN